MQIRWFDIFAINSENQNLALNSKYFKIGAKLEKIEIPQKKILAPNSNNSKFSAKFKIFKFDAEFKKFKI